MGRWLILVAVLGGCTKRNPAACCTTETDCEAKGLPAGSDCDDGYTCIRNACVAPVSCQSASDCESPTPLCDTATSVCVECIETTDCADGICDSNTNSCRPCSEDSECESGYCDVPTGQCGANVARWKYVPSACETAAANPLTVANVVTINTANVGECIGGTETQAAGPEICVLHYSSISIASGGTLRIVGTRAVALVGDANVDITGIIDVSADPTTGANGPGGGTRISGDYPDVVSQVDLAGKAGGGGAGFKTVGGNGGAATNGGAAYDPIAATDFLGGAKAGPDTLHVGPARRGGGGGGALTVISCAGKLTVSGSINASGAGGGRGDNVVTASGTNSRPGGGFGGGAGGNVLLQGWEIEVSGSFLANGGGGGPGLDMNAGPGGTPSFVAPCPPPTPVTGSSTAGAGGQAGCGATPPGSGAMASVASSTSGGGGGSVGYFRTATPTGTPMVNPTMAEPAFSQSETVPRI